MAKVFLCSNRLTGENAAVKIMEKRLLKKNMIERFKKEIYLMKALDSPYIVDVIEYFEDAEWVYVCLEYLKGGELFNEINLRKKNKTRFTEK